jgi:hypothetical protein
MARAKVSKNDNLIDPKLKRSFIEARDHWKSLDDRANSAAAKRRQYQKEIKEAGFSMQQIKDSLRLMTPEGEAEFKAEIANRLLAAAYSDADIGEQLSLFLEDNRTPAADRAYKEGQTSAMKNEAAVPKYAPDTDQYQAFMQGYHDEQGRQVKSGIKKLETAPEKPAKGRKVAKPEKAAKAPGKRGRPPGSGKKAAKADEAPPRRAPAQPVTRAALAAQRAAGAAAQPQEEADSFFTKAPAGNA